MSPSFLVSFAPRRRSVNRRNQPRAVVASTSVLRGAAKQLEGRIPCGILVRPNLGENAMSEALRTLQQRVAAFAVARDWEPFHSPKNLAMALSVEAAELVEEFQWLTEEQSRVLDAERRERVRLELADVFIYLLRIADKLGVDLVAAANDKIVLNEKKYPVDRVRGDARKYTEYD
jgi:dCTP diphosphatase